VKRPVTGRATRTLTASTRSHVTYAHPVGHRRAQAKARIGGPTAPMSCPCTRLMACRRGRLPGQPWSAHGSAVLRPLPTPARGSTPAGGGGSDSV
jgi:hypothetical protein